MRDRKVFRAAAWGLALGLAALTATARADEKDPQKVEKRRFVVVDRDGNRQVFEGNGPLMRRGYLGVGLAELTPELRTHFGVPEGQGVMVSRIEPGSPAEKAGIRVADILTAIDGQDVKTSWDVMRKVRGLEDGQQVPVELWRNGKAQNVTVTAVQKERPELDLGPLLLQKDGGGEPLVLQMDRDRLLRGWQEGLRLRGPEAQGRRLVTPRERELEKKLKDLEKRIDELEKQLGKPRG